MNIAMALLSAGIAWMLFDLWHRSRSGTEAAPKHTFLDIPIDPAYGDPTARDILAKSDENERCSQAIALLRNFRENDWDAREFYSGVLGSELSLSALERYLETTPNDPEALLLRGIRRIDWAWEARGKGLANTVSETAAKLMFDRLLLAQKDLLDAHKALPTDHLPFVNLLNVSLGLGYEDEVAQQFFEEALLRFPSSWAAHAFMLNRLCARWFGSPERRYSFARSFAKTPVHPDLSALLICAHIEQWIDTEEDTFSKPSALAEVNAAFDYWLANPSYRQRKTSLFAWNQAAFWFHRTGDLPRLRRCFEQLNDRTTGAPWQYIGNPRELFSIAKAAAR